MIRLSGRLRSALIIGGQGMRARKLRTFLSILSLFLGVLAVVVVQAGAETARAAALSNVELSMGKDGTLETFLPGGSKTIEIALDTVKDRPNVVLSLDMQATVGEPGVTTLNPGGAPFEHAGRGGGPPAGIICDFQGCWEDPNAAARPKPQGKAVEMRVMAMSADVRQFREFRLISGEWLNFSGSPGLSPRIVLNKDAAKFFSTYQIPAEMQISGATANLTPRIVGVVDDGMMEPRAYLRMDELFNWLQPGALANASAQMLLAPEAADVMQILKTRLVAAGDKHAEGLNAHPVQSAEMVEDQLSLLRWVFLGMAGLVLLIGVAGILNVGLATVGERIEEFALRRAVGTPRTLLAGIVLAETLLTGLLTAAAAIGCAALGLRFARGFLAGQSASLADISFPWQAGVAGIIAGLIAGLLGGLIPAIRAARIPIATVMRA
ncbi:ABC transporter permease [Catelliglobosispora koreensis]|uniref:ABC transporter permease n=1 Tax=Catelliglobosispora koreensis TaxID=129052 RepID=UPI00035D69DA|nr:ABC transporter permease [Catelliglobosispora koreensis]